MTSAAVGDVDEKRILDTDYSNRDRKGCDPDFPGLIVPVPVPTLTAKAMKLVSRRLDVDMFSKCLSD